MKAVVIDTNVYCQAMRGDPPATKLLRQSEKLLMPSVVVGELLAGFKGGDRERTNKDQLRAFMGTERVQVANVTAETAEFYAMILSRLRKQGTPVPTNDIWIAAITMEHGAGLATLDGHFSKIDGLFLVEY